MKANKVKFAIQFVKTGLTLKLIAKQAGITRQTISAVKNGKNCYPSTIEKVASALGVDVKDILEEE